MSRRVWLKMESEPVTVQRNQSRRAGHFALAVTCGVDARQHRRDLSRSVFPPCSGCTAGSPAALWVPTTTARLAIWTARGRACGQRGRLRRLRRHGQSDYLRLAQTKDIGTWHTPYALLAAPEAVRVLSTLLCIYSIPACARADPMTTTPSWHAVHTDELRVLPHNRV